MDIKDYRKIFQDNGIDLSEKEVLDIIQNIDNIGELLFNKYTQHEQQQ